MSQQPKVRVMAGFAQPWAWRWPAFALYWLLFAHSLPAQGLELTERLLADARDGQLNNFDLFTAALIASGCENADQLADWSRQYTVRSQRLLEFQCQGSAGSQLQQIHAALHGEFLPGQYGVTATDLRQAISKGDFNCLSSLVIYLDLCQRAGLDLEIWWQPGHVFVRYVAAGQAPVIVEPGARNWGSAPASQRAKRRTLARQLSPVQLLGKFYYNRGVIGLQSGQYAEGLELLRTSLALDPDDRDAQVNLVAGLNNWAVEYFRDQRYRDAAPLIEQGLKLDPSFAPLIANQRILWAKLGER